MLKSEIDLTCALSRSDSWEISLFSIGSGRDRLNVSPPGVNPIITTRRSAACLTRFTTPLFSKQSIIPVMLEGVIYSLRLKSADDMAPA